MDDWSHLIVGAVLATAELCAEPLMSGADEPPLCRLDRSQEVATPFFSIRIEPDFLVGVDREGRRMLVTSTLWKRPDQLTIEVFEGSGTSDLLDCDVVEETIEDDVTWQECHRTGEGSFERQLVARLKDMRVLIRYIYAAAATKRAPELERMVQSIEIHAT